MFCPIRRWETVLKECGDTETHFEVFPESFRICFTVYFLCFCAIAIFVTVNFGTTDMTDNPVLNRFGYNNVCVMFDDPPFAIFGSTLWFPATILLMSFEFFDYIRVYDHYYDRDEDYPISKGFLVYYTISTVFESASVILFTQIFATSPTEHIYMHTLPFLMFMFAFWLIALKRFLYLRIVGIVPRYGHVWIVICALSTSIHFSQIAANLYGARLWERHPWTKPPISANVYLWFFAVMVAPVIIYGVIGREIDTVKVTLNRHNANLTKESAVPAS